MNYIILNSIVSLLNFLSGIHAKIFLSEMSATNCPMIQGEKNLYLHLLDTHTYTHTHAHTRQLIICYIYAHTISECG